jgi:4,5:9,10-diseco-3-hydroxy-5,9,17-trioxoandrosta-1(10),2-diene-4-oate hydrolase
MYTPDVKNYGKSVKSDCVNKTYITDELIEALYNLEQNPSQYKTTLKVLRKYMNWMGQKSSVYGPILHRLSSITSPTLVIWGRQDDTLPLKQGELAVKSLPNAHLETIDNCGHIPMFDQPEIFNKLLLEFLRD